VARITGDNRAALRRRPGHTLRRAGNFLIGPPPQPAGRRGLESPRALLAVGVTRAPAAVRQRTCHPVRFRAAANWGIPNCSGEEIPHLLAAAEQAAPTAANAASVRRCPASTAIVERFWGCLQAFPFRLSPFCVRGDSSDRAFITMQIKRPGSHQALHTVLPGPRPPCIADPPCVAIKRREAWPLARRRKRLRSFCVETVSSPLNPRIQGRHLRVSESPWQGSAWSQRAKSRSMSDKTASGPLGPLSLS
jgi:hypothetical protein